MQQQIPSGFIFFPPSLQDSSLIPSVVLTLPPKPSLAPHVNKVKFRLLDLTFSISVICFLTSNPTAPLCPNRDSQSWDVLATGTAHSNLNLVCLAQFDHCL